jgi:hypothetical protein
MSEVDTNAETGRRLELYVKDLLRSIFVETQGSYLTPDVAMEILEKILNLRISSLEAKASQLTSNPRLLRADSAVFRRKIHHHAVDLLLPILFPSQEARSR